MIYVPICMQQKQEMDRQKAERKGQIFFYAKQGNVSWKKWKNEVDSKSEEKEGKEIPSGNLT